MAEAGILVGNEINKILKESYIVILQPEFGSNSKASSPWQEVFFNEFPMLSYVKLSSTGATILVGKIGSCNTILKVIEQVTILQDFNSNWASIFRQVDF